MSDRGAGGQRRAAMRALVVEAHAGQSRNAGRVPYAAHVLSVGCIIDDAIQLGGELADDPQLALDIHLAGLGHDLYEDTDVTPETIRAQFGERVELFIEGMTNRQSDSDRAQYVAKMAEAPEPVRLIKLADLVDNITSCAYGIHDLGADWIDGTFRPIVTEMSAVVGRGDYQKLPRTSSLMASWLEFSFLRLESNLEIARGLAGVFQD